MRWGGRWRTPIYVTLRVPGWHTAFTQAARIITHHTGHPITIHTTDLATWDTRPADDVDVEIRWTPWLTAGATVWPLWDGLNLVGARVGMKRLDPTGAPLLALHELGHVVGLAHPHQPGHLMSAGTHHPITPSDRMGLWHVSKWSPISE